MSDGKRYFWLRLYDDFFDSKRIKKLRKLAGGDTFTIIYLKLQLIAMKHDGVLTWTGLEENVAEELALDINEDPDNVEITLRYLLSCGLAETSDNINYFFPYAVKNVGSEGASAQRWRDWNDRQKQKALESNATLLESNTSLTQCKHFTNGEIEKEIEKESDIEIDIESKPKKRFTPPTLEEVKAYCLERKNNVDAEKFYAYYSAGQWKDGNGKPVKNWKQKVITWEKTGDEKKPNKVTTAAKYDAPKPKLDDLRKAVAKIAD